MEKQSQLFKECTHGIFNVVIIVLIVSEKKWKALVWYRPSYVIRLSGVSRNFVCGLQHSSQRCYTKMFYIVLAEYCHGFGVFLKIKA